MAAPTCGTTHGLLAPRRTAPFPGSHPSPPQGGGGGLRRALPGGRASDVAGYPPRGPRGLCPRASRGVFKGSEAVPRGCSCPRSRRTATRPTGRTSSAGLVGPHRVGPRASAGRSPTRPGN
jgi:hypothetical protein